MDYLSAKVLMKESWDFEGLNKIIQLPKNKIDAACRPYSLAYIECLLSDTEMTDMCDDNMGKMQ